MTDPLLDPPSHAQINPAAVEGLPRAGSPAGQLALQAAAWDMLETHQPPRAKLTTRLANAWLGERDWRVQIVPHYVHTDCEEWLRPLMAAARAAGQVSLLGTDVSPLHSRPSAVWRLPLDEHRIGPVLFAHYDGLFLLFPEDRRFAVLYDDVDTATYAGPEAFLRAALPDGAVGAATTQEVRDTMEEEYGPGSADDILAWYGPFLLD